MTNQKVLVLNSSYIPMYITTVMKSITLLFREKAEVIETVGDSSWSSHTLKSWEEVSSYKRDNEIDIDFLKGGNDYVLGVPKVIRLVKFSKRSPKVNLTRGNIFLRDNNICQFCNTEFNSYQLNIDHVIPKSKGGKNTWENLVCSCVKCNTKKRNRTPKEAGMTLARQPKKPSQFLIFKRFIKRINEEPYKDWIQFFPKDFISECYWNCEIEQ